jgi:hypothetical protein
MIGRPPARDKTLGRAARGGRSSFRPCTPSVGLTKRRATAVRQTAGADRGSRPGLERELGPVEVVVLGGVVIDLSQGHRVPEERIPPDREVHPPAQGLI